MSRQHIQNTCYTVSNRLRRDLWERIGEGNEEICGQFQTEEIGSVGETGSNVSDKIVPGARMESPSGNPMISLIFLRTTCSIKMKIGAISYVNLEKEPVKDHLNVLTVTYMLVLAAAVSHSPARDTMSSPHDS